MNRPHSGIRKAPGPKGMTPDLIEGELAVEDVLTGVKRSRVWSGYRTRSCLIRRNHVAEEISLSRLESSDGLAL